MPLLLKLDSFHGAVSCLDSVAEHEAKSLKNPETEARVLQHDASQVCTFQNKHFRLKLTGRGGQEIVRLPDKSGPATKKPSLSKYPDQDGPLPASKLHGSFKGNLSLSNDKDVFSSLSLLEDRLAWFVSFDMAKAGNLFDVRFLQAPEKFRTLQHSTDF
jgi:hypothetical protein